MNITNCMWCNSTNFKDLNNGYWTANKWCLDCGMIQDERCFRFIGEPNVNEGWIVD